MKLKKDQIEFFKRVIDAANLVGIESVLIEKGRVKGMEQGKNESVVFILENNVPELPFDGIGLTRIDILANRLAIAESMDGFTIDAVIDDSAGSSLVKSLLMTAKGFKVEYRCANPKAVKKAPSQMAEEFKYQISFDEDAVAMLTKGRSAMGADLVTVVGNNNEATFEFVDVNNDVFSYTFSKQIKNLIDDDISFVFRFPVDLLLAMLKKTETGYFQISQTGLLGCTVFGINTVIMPKA